MRLPTADMPKLQEYPSASCVDRQGDFPPTRNLLPGEDAGGVRIAKSAGRNGRRLGDDEASLARRAVRNRLP